ncbi:MAG: hypothetical protein IH986_11360 [Planctomycetes bacterium]|nr:hypothetical protein [Planctomycetota bacterium]
MRKLASWRLVAVFHLGLVLMGPFSFKCNVNPAAIDRAADLINGFDGDIDIDIDFND